jgi:hypothetical protein
MVRVIGVILGLGLTSIGIFFCWYIIYITKFIEADIFHWIYFTGGLFLTFASIPYFWFIKPYRERRKRV